MVSALTSASTRPPSALGSSITVQATALPPAGQAALKPVGSAPTENFPNSINMTSSAWLGRATQAGRPAESLQLHDLDQVPLLRSGHLWVPTALTPGSRPR